ncbi:MAG: class I poly(R)-hydroxyalkanoic acid synthase [Hyphococcus sp.]|nr:MAG: class I poly(R)-hydroxyalkanoic acid synthase [Marinicaulis sp.]
MTDDPKNIWQTPPAIPDVDALSDAWRRVFTSGVDAMFATGERARAMSTTPPYDPFAPARAFTEFATALIADPTALQKTQASAFKEWSELLQRQTMRMSGQPTGDGIKEDRSDRRFADPAWTDDPFFSAIKESYLIAARNMIALAAETKGIDASTRARIDFFTRQYIYAMAPTNFAMTNPAVLRKTLETGGLNLLGGLANFLTDYASTDSWVQRRASDEFELGKDIAATPGAVIYQNEVMQLIQYEPSTKKTYKRPMLYVPPLVNKYYLMDLKPKSSLLKWLVDEGHTVFTISWKNPDASHQHLDLTDYVLEGPVAALGAIEDATGESQVDLFSFCMGGAIASAALAYLTQTGKGDKIASATMMATLIDYSKLGEWSTFTEAQQVEAFNDHIHAKGVISGDDLKKLFSVVRANDLIWSSVVDHYLLDHLAPPSDLLHWFADGANMPKAFLATWSRDILRENKLAIPGALKIGDVAIDFGKVKTPVFNLALRDDHVSAWDAVYDNGAHFGGPVTFVLGGSGHNAGIINPPSRGKHGYHVSKKKADTAEDWLENAEQKEGSWWPEWQSWLTSGKLSQEQTDARYIGSGNLKPIEPAPGSYVRG